MIVCVCVEKCLFYIQCIPSNAKMYIRLLIQCDKIVYQCVLLKLLLYKYHVIQWTSMNKNYKIHTQCITILESKK